MPTTLGGTPKSWTFCWLCFGLQSTGDLIYIFSKQTPGEDDTDLKLVVLKSPIGCALALAKGNLWLCSGPRVRHNCHGMTISKPFPKHNPYLVQKVQDFGVPPSVLEWCIKCHYLHTTWKGCLLTHRLLIIDREVGEIIHLVVSVYPWTFSRLNAWMYDSKKSHETQNQPNRLLQGSITNPCVCLQSVVRRVYLALAVDHALHWRYFQPFIFLPILYSCRKKLLKNHLTFWSLVYFLVKT